MNPALYNISKAFGSLVLFREFSAEFPQNAISCILGPSGCGKTTLLRMLNGTLKPDEGRVTGMDGRSPAYIFQEPRLLPWKTVRENLAFVLEGKLDRSKIHHLIREYLALVNLTEFSDYYPVQLSGGMKQRVSIARAFCYPSDIILMDEPFKGLDVKLKKNLTEAFLRMWTAHPHTVIFVTHDPEEAISLGQYIYILSRPPAEILFSGKNDQTPETVSKLRELIQSKMFQEKQ